MTPVWQKQPRTLSHHLTLIFGLMAVASCVLYGAISLASVWQAEVQGMGESSRYAAQFIAASVAPEVAADDRPQLLERLHALQASSFVSTSCVYSATDEELVAAFGPSVCPTNAADRLDQHFYGSHLVRWQGQTVGQVIVFVPYEVARSKVAGFLPILAIPFLFAFAVALFVTRRLARQASQGIADIVQQLQSDDAAPISPSRELNAPKEVQQLAGAFNQRLSSLIDARNAAELQARQRESVELAERRARQLIRNIIDLVPYIIYAQRTDGTLVFANLAAAELYNVPVEQLVSPAFAREQREDDVVRNGEHEVERSPSRCRWLRCRKRHTYRRIRTVVLGSLIEVEWGEELGIAQQEPGCSLAVPLMHRDHPVQPGVQAAREQEQHPVHERRNTGEHSQPVLDERVRQVQDPLHERPPAGDLVGRVDDEHRAVFGGSNVGHDHLSGGARSAPPPALHSRSDGHAEPGPNVPTPQDTNQTG